MGSSSIEDQGALIADRAECILELEKPVTTTEEIETHDHLKLFTGDHPAAQFDRGTQWGAAISVEVVGAKTFLWTTKYIFCSVLDGH